MEECGRRGDVACGRAFLAFKDFVVAADKEYICVVACNACSSVVTIEVKDGFGIEVIVHIGHSEFDGS